MDFQLFSKYIPIIRRTSFNIWSIATSTIRRGLIGTAKGPILLPCFKIIIPYYPGEENNNVIRIESLFEFEISVRFFFFKQTLLVD